MLGFHQAALQSTEQLAIASGMRVVILEQDAEIRDELQRALHACPLFSATRLAQSWHECERYLDDFLPELLILRANLVPQQVMHQLVQRKFPVRVWLGADSEDKDAIALHKVDERELQQALADAAAEILRRKACDLFMLVQQYLAGNSRWVDYISVLKAQEGDAVIEIPVDGIVSVSASGNYVRVHTTNKTYEIRETMTGISAKLDPVCFVRVQRSHIVNLSYVYELVQKDSISSFVRLCTGMEIPIGPNYRSEIFELISQRQRMIA